MIKVEKHTETIQEVAYSVHEAIYLTYGLNIEDTDGIQLLPNSDQVMVFTKKHTGFTGLVVLINLKSVEYYKSNIDKDTDFKQINSLTQNINGYSNTHTYEYMGQEIKVGQHTDSRNNLIRISYKESLATNPKIAVVQ